MSFVDPQYLWLLLLAAPLVLLLSWRRRRQVAHVSSLTLWRDLLPEASRSRLPLGWPPRRWLSLLLLLGGLAALTLALARPQRDGPPRRVVAIVDGSTSMQARSSAGSRWDAAWPDVQRLLGTLRPGDLAWVIVAGDVPRVVAGPILGAYGRTERPTAPQPPRGRADLSAACQLARSLEPSEVWLWSDGSDGRALPLEDVRWVRPDPAQEDLHLAADLELGERRLRVTARLENRGSAPVRCAPQLSIAGGSLLSLPPRTVAPGARLRLVPLELDRPRGACRVSFAARSADQTPFDDRLSWAIPPAPELVVGVHDPSGDRFLRAALANDEGISLAPPAQASILVQTAPLPDLPGPRLRIGPGALPSDLRLTGERPLPPQPLIHSPHPILDGVSLDGLLGERVSRLEAGAGWQVLASVGDAPLVLAREVVRREVVIPFDPAATDLVLRRAYPLLIANTLRWLADTPSQQAGWAREGHRLPGDDVPLHADPAESGAAATSLPGAQPTSPPATVASDPRSLWLLIAALLWLVEGALAWKARRHLPSTLVRLGLLALLVVAWLDPRVPVPDRRPRSLVAVVDRSASVDPAQADAELARLRAGLGPDDTLAVVNVGADAARDAAVDPAGTNLAAGLRLAPTAFAPGSRPEVLVLSDGHATQGDAKLEASTLRRCGASVRARALTPARGRPTVTGLTADRTRAVRGEGLAVLATVYAPEPGSVSVSLERADAAGDERRWTRTVELAPQRNALRFADVAGPRGLQRYTLRIEGDPPEANAGHLVVPVSGSQRTLLVAGAEGLGDSVAQTLREAGYTVTVRDPGGAPESLDAARAFDLFVLVDVPAAPERGGRPLTPAAQEALVAAVREGAGLFVLGGQRAYGLGGYAGSILEGALPLRSLPPQAELPEVALLLLVDRSASMRGPKLALAKLGAREAMRHLAPRDLLGVIGFNAAARWSTPLTPAGTSEPDRRDPLFAAGGGTDLVPALRLARAALDACPATVKHVVALSDGIAPREAELLQLAGELRTAGVTVSTVAVGGDANQGLMGRLARAGGGTHHVALDPRRVPRLLVDEARSATLRAIRERIQARSVDATPAVRGLDLAAAPPLLGRALTEAKPGARIAVAGGDGHPLLADAELGLGRVACWTADGGERWARLWSEWRGFPQLLRQQARVLAPPPRPLADLEWIVDSEGVEVRGERLPRVVEVVGGAALTCDVVGAGRARAPLPSAQGALLLRARDEAGAVLDRRGIHLPLPSPERPVPAADEASLRALEGDGAPAKAWLGLGAAAAGLALVLLFLDLLLRARTRARVARRRTPQLHSS